MVFITGRNKRAIEDHFDAAHELEMELEAGGKTELLEVLHNAVPKDIHCIYIRQPAPLGLGHAVLCARPVIGHEPFAVLLADDLMDVDKGHKPVLAQMLDVYRHEGASVLAVQNVPPEETRQYGIVSARPFKERLELVDGIVEKPLPEVAPSNLGVVGRYVLSNSIFDCLESIGKGAGGEIQLTDGIAALMKQEQVMAYRFAGRRFDCGSKLGYLQATVAMGLKHPEMGAAFARYLEQQK
jgi:UTP--glucose-1-phosphate uridylyltransferase